MEKKQLNTKREGAKGCSVNNDWLAPWTWQPGSSKKKEKRNYPYFTTIGGNNAWIKHCFCCFFSVFTAKSYVCCLGDFFIVETMCWEMTSPTKCCCYLLKNKRRKLIWIWKDWPKCCHVLKNKSTAWRIGCQSMKHHCRTDVGCIRGGSWCFAVSS